MAKKMVEEDSSDDGVIEKVNIVITKLKGIQWQQY